MLTLETNSTAKGARAREPIQ